MIIYSKTFWGLPLLSRVYGSALPRVLAPSLASGLITLLLMLAPLELSGLWGHPYAYSPFVLIVSFVLAFRSNYAYQRHWEAYTNKQTMTARWVDAVMQIVMFDRYSLPAAALPAATKAAPLHRTQQHQVTSDADACAAAAAAAATAAAIACHQQFVAELVHLVSLLHGVACQALRRDPDLRNLIKHSDFEEAPPQDPALLDQTVLPSAASAGGSGGAAAVPNSAAAAPAAAPAGAGPAAADRSGVRLPSRFNWRDIFMLRGSKTVIIKYNAAQPLPIIGGVSREEVAAIGCCCTADISSTATGGGNGPSDAPTSGSHHSCSHSNGLGFGFRQRCSSDDTGGSAAVPAATNGHLRSFKHGQQQLSLASMKGAASFLGSFRRRGHHARPDQQQQTHQQLLGRASRALSGLARTSRQQQQRLSRDAEPSAAAPATTGSNSRPSTGGCSSADGSTHAGLQQHRHRHRLQRVANSRFRVSLNCSCCAAHLPYMERPALVMSWLHELLLQRQAAGGLTTPAPILARVYQCLSDGLVGFEQCRKLADTPFPFPWAQFVLVMLVIFTLTLPLMVLAYVQNSALAIVLTVVTVGTYFTVNEVARDVEDPFLYEPNDMPLANSQYYVNELLLTLSSAQRPSSSMRLRHLRLPSALGLSPQPWQQQQQAAAGAAAASSGISNYGSRLNSSLQQQQQFDTQLAPYCQDSAAASCSSQAIQQSYLQGYAVEVAAAAATFSGFGGAGEADDVMAARDLSHISEAAERERSAAAPAPAGDGGGCGGGLGSAAAAAALVSTAGAAAGAVRFSLEVERSSSSQQQRQADDADEASDEGEQAEAQEDGAGVGADRLVAALVPAAGAGGAGTAGGGRDTGDDAV